MQNNEKEVAKTMPKAPEMVERMRELYHAGQFYEVMFGVKAHEVCLADLPVFSDFIGINGGRHGINSQILKIVGTFFEPKIYELLDQEQITFLQSLCTFGAGLQEVWEEMFPEL